MLRTIIIAGTPPLQWPHEGLRRLQIDVPLPDAIANTLPRPLPGTAQSAWFDDAPSLLRGHDTARLDAFIAAGSHRLVVREHVLFAGTTASTPNGGVKLMSFFCRKPGMDVAAFEDYWRHRHGPIVARTPHLRRYVQSHLVPEHRRAATPPFCDGLTELWFDSLADFTDGWASPAMQQEQFTDSAAFIGEGVMHSVTMIKNAWGDA
jgi:uncharacterized protein (TIGR02118 family)